MVSEIDPTINGTLQAFQGDFTFDSSVVAFQSTAVEVAGLTAVPGTTWSLAANVLGTGTIRILRVSCFTTNNSVLDSTGMGPQPLFNLKFVRVSNTTGASTALTWRLPRITLSSSTRMGSRARLPAHRLAASP